jgi:hypothetical protein
MDLSADAWLCRILPRSGDIVGVHLDLPMMSSYDAIQSLSDASALESLGDKWAVFRSATFVPSLCSL